MKDIARHRMYIQRLWGPPTRNPAEVVGAFAAMQAQEYLPAKWMVAQRAGGAGASPTTEATVERLLAEGAILRTHVLRPTWHFVRREDARWLLGVSGPRVDQINAYYYRQTGLDAELFARAHELMRGALAGGVHLTRPELAEALKRGGIEASGTRLAYVVMQAELNLVIISGARRGRQHTYALFDERVPDPATLDPEAALAELARRFFTMRGPATVRDFAVWASLPIADARRGQAMAAAHLEERAVDGRVYHGAPGRPRDTRPSPTVDLVQAYDEIVMSYSESRDVLAPDGGVPSAGTLLHTVLLDGRAFGRWKPTVTARSVLVETSFHRTPNAAERAAVDAAVARFGEFLDLPASWATTPRER